MIQDKFIPARKMYTRNMKKIENFLCMPHHSRDRDTSRIETSGHTPKKTTKNPNPTTQPNFSSIKNEMFHCG